MKLKIILLYLVICLTPKVYSFNKIKTYEGKTFEVSGALNYTDTNSNFNNNGTKTNLINSNKLSLIDSLFQARYVFNNTISINGSINITNAESKNTDFNRSNSTVNVITASADYIAYRSFVDIIPEFTFKYSLDPISNNQDTVMTNEGVLELLAMLKAQNNYSKFNYYLGIGFNYRSERSGTVPWYIGGGLKWGHSSFLGLELGGFQSVVDDGDKGTLEAARYSLIQKVNGGSYHFYSVNPSHTIASLNLDLGITDGIVAKSFIGSSLAGQNHSSELQIGVMVTLLFDAIVNNSKNSVPVFEKKESNSSYQRANENESYSKKSKNSLPPIETISPKTEEYKIQTDDGVDQKLFQTDPDETTKIYKNKKSKQLSDEEIQSQLDQAEMTIKLKSNKKKKRK